MFTIAKSRAALRREEQQTPRVRRDSVGVSARSAPLAGRERAEVVELLGRLQAAGFRVIDEPKDGRWFVHRADMQGYVGDAQDAARMLDQASARAARPTRQGMSARPAECILALRAIGYDVTSMPGGRFLLLRGAMAVRSMDLQELRRCAFPGPSK